MSQVLLSVPPHLRDFLHSAAGRPMLRRRLPELAGDKVFVGTDPKERRLGSGGGTVNLLHQAWQAAGRRQKGAGIFEWLARGQRLVLHAGGESRRLPAYAGLGKVFLPMPAVEGLAPRRFDQMLMDFQIPPYQQTLAEAGPQAAVLVTAGDVWLDFNPLQIPPTTADITGIGMRVPAAMARHFGVYFVGKAGRAGGGAQSIAFFRQKPAPAEIRRQGARYDFYVDTGMWLLSVPALRLLFRRCGWDERRGRFTTPDGHPRFLDLYTEVGLALGTEAAATPALRRLGWPQLSSSVIPLGQARFHHLGSNRQLFDSFAQIQRGQAAPQRVLTVATPADACVVRGRLPVWVDGACPRRPLALAGHNLVTGLPPAARLDRLAQGWCLDLPPVGGGRWAFRPYHVNDNLRGRPGGGARICGQDARTWLVRRGLPAPAADVFDLPIYPVLTAAAIDQELLDWFFARQPDPRLSARVAAGPRLSARQIPERIDFARLLADRRRSQAGVLQAGFTAWRDRSDAGVFAQDFAAIAELCRHGAPGLRQWLRRQGPAFAGPAARPEQAARWLHLLSELAGGRGRTALRAAGQARVQQALLASSQLQKSRPVHALKDDQIVWARSPVRLDLAGGWTDTPPYCLSRGGAVLNVAVLLNGQPPVQVFVRPIPEPHFRLRSIDLGVAEDLGTYAALAAFRDPRSGFSLAKAALALAGFHPDYRRGGADRSLRAQLRAFGGGLEISLLSAVPKGSGLGTSSILGATLLGALNRACGLGWDEVDLYQRVLGIEQLLTTGGGWQDQAGALFPGLKLVQTEPGLAQIPTVRHLPAGLLGAGAANRSVLLYYTGLTRLAKGILQEIVHDMALGRCGTMRTLDLIRRNAWALEQATQEADAAGLRRCIARSWDLNRRLDPATTNPEIGRIIAACGPGLAASKLLGAGGGGYMLMCARDAAAGAEIRARLEARPPNARARFIDFQVSEQALEVTVS
jgi:galactokinase/mevalonate kinase-like predicted kinase